MAFLPRTLWLQGNPTDCECSEAQRILRRNHREGQQNSKNCAPRCRSAFHLPPFLSFPPLSLLLSLSLHSLLSLFLHSPLSLSLSISLSLLLSLSPLPSLVGRGSTGRDWLRSEWLESSQDNGSEQLQPQTVSLPFPPSSSPQIITNTPCDVCTHTACLSDFFSPAPPLPPLLPHLTHTVTMS